MAADENFDANYKNTPVTEEVKNEQIENTIYPNYLFPHGNDYCAIIGGTGWSNSNQMEDLELDSSDNALNNVSVCVTVNNNIHILYLKIKIWKYYF